MKTKFRILTVLVCAVMLAFSFAACDPKESQGESTLLGKPSPHEKVDYSELNQDDYKTFQKSVEAFAADFAEYSYADYQKQENFAVSPISVYMALSLAAECAAGDTRAEILGALGVTHEQLQTHFSTLYRSLAVEHKSDGQTTGMLNLANSIWVNEGTSVKKPCVDVLSNDFFASSYSADFEHKNAQANQAVRAYIKEQTKGLIDKDFQLSENTLFTLINALYLKTIWNEGGTDLSFAKDNYTFTAKDGSTKATQLLQGGYVGGRAIAFDTFTTFYAKTYNGYKIKFILPEDGYSIDQVFTAENIAAVNSIANYGEYADFDPETETITRYVTRVLFPEYKCKYDEDIRGILHDKFDIDLFFKDPGVDSPACNFSTLSDEACFCSQIRHVTDLTVNRKGIEGAAVTVIGIDAATAAPTVTIREDFIVDKSFGFIITTYNDVTLFSGVVNNI